MTIHSLTLFPHGELQKHKKRYWIAQNQRNPDFWGHEFSKHATCYSTFDVECYGPQYVEHQEVVDFFETAISFYRGVPTHAWLAAAAIVPSNSTTYTLSDLQAALTDAFGAVPYLGCSGAAYNTTEAGAGSTDAGKTVLTEVWYCKCPLHLFGINFLSFLHPVEGVS